MKRMKKEKAVRRKRTVVGCCIRIDFPTAALMILLCFKRESFSLLMGASVAENGMQDLDKEKK